MRRHLVSVVLLSALIFGPAALRAQSAPSGVALGNILYFSGSDPAHGAELWRSDGTVAGTRLSIDIRPGRAGSNPRDLTAFQGRLWFTVDDGAHGREIWSTDGTAAGTRLLADTCPGSCTWLAPGAPLVPSGNRLFFLLKKALDRDYRLWSTDGTTGGTAESLTLGFSASILAPLPNGRVLLSVTPTGFGGTDYLWAGDTQGAEDLGLNGARRPIPLGNAVLFWKDSTLWRTDGTAAGTQVVQQNLSVPTTPPMVRNGVAYFSNNEGLWESDGTTAGTIKLRAGLSDATFAASPCGPVFRSSELIWRIQEPQRQVESLSHILNTGAVLGPWSAGDRVFYATEKTGESETPELWKVDPRTCQVRKVIALCTASQPCAPGVPLPVQQPAGAGRIGFFVVQTAAGRLVLWRTDGTAKGTFRLATIGRTGSPS
jgi:ELWxxDGT repeat protein